ncbi:Golgi-associated RAB2 interactor protein 5B [Myotis daubentonii]|uniref:Golgi-associated RAB2 interactor protein 5B n=1 Tax=Myotis daubentonii TaxID=98922 RepID=UPI002872B950|nr:Golgi-associated RAB2 interactor protein 5B [Myotis daubentonii]
MNRLWNTRRVDALPGPPTWVPILGQLQRTLQMGDYLPLRPLPMFESNFVQVTSRGAPVYVHHRTNRLTMGVAASLPGPVLPDLLLIARPSESRDCSNLILTRMIPLDLVRLYVHNRPGRCLKLRLLTGRYYYLELNAPDREMAFLFDHWIRLINLLQEPTAYWAPGTLHTPLSDLAHAAPPASTWHLQNQPRRRRSAVAAPKQKQAKASRPQFKSQAVGDSVPLIWSQLEPPSARKKASEKKSRPDPRGQGSQTKTAFSVRGQVPSAPVKPSVTIRTIFSIFPELSAHSCPRPKVCSPAGAMVLGGLVEAPSPGVSNSTDVSLLVSYKHVYMREALGDLADPNSSTLYPPTPSPSLCLTSRASGPSLGIQAWPQDPAHRPRPPPSPKTPSAQAASRKAPATREHPQKVPAELAPSREAPAGRAAPKKTPALASAPRKAPRKTPRFAATPRKAAARPVPCPEPGSLPSPSPQALTPGTCYQMACDSAHLGVGPAGSRAGVALESSQPEGKTEPLVLVGTQETQVTEVWAQKMSLELPGHTARREIEEVVVGRAHEVALDGLKGRAQVEDRLRSSKEERLVDLPGLRSQATGQRRKWVKTQQLAVEGAPGAPGRPFSVEDLTLARMTILAKAKEPPLRPRLFGLPSWLWFSQALARSTRGPKPLSPRQAAPERPRLGPWVKGGVGLLVEETLSTQAAAAEQEKLPSAQRGSFKVRPRCPSVPGSPKLDRVSQAPIPLPATRWEDVPSPAVPSPISKMEARVSQKLHREAAEVEGGPSLESLVPTLLELEKGRNSASAMEQTKARRPVFTRWPSVLTERALPSLQQAWSSALSVAGSGIALSRYKVRRDPMWPGPRRRGRYEKTDAGQAGRGAPRLQ